jgi:hypothetical protein
MRATRSTSSETSADSGAPMPCFRLRVRRAISSLAARSEVESPRVGVSIKYVGHAQESDATEVDGRFEAQDCAVTYERAGSTLAVATISRDLQNLQAEAAMKASLATGPII